MDSAIENSQTENYVERSNRFIRLKHKSLCWIVAIRYSSDIIQEILFSFAKPQLLEIIANVAKITLETYQRADMIIIRNSL